MLDRQKTTMERKVMYLLFRQENSISVVKKASSNICSNQALCALAVGVYLATMGNEGIKKAATLSTSKHIIFQQNLQKVGYQTENKGEFFHEFVTVSDVPPAKALCKALEEKERNPWRISA